MKLKARILHFLGFPKKELAYICCGNCEEFEEWKKDKAKGFCPAMYWRYNLSWVCRTSYCSTWFRLAKRFQDEYKIKIGSRKKEECLVERLKNAGRKEVLGIISDCVMLFGNTK